MKNAMVTNTERMPRTGVVVVDHMFFRRLRMLSFYPPSEIQQPAIAAAPPRP